MFNRNAFDSVNNLRNRLFDAKKDRSKRESAKSRDKKRLAPKPFALRLESLEERHLLSAVSPFAESPVDQKPAVESYSVSSAISIPDLSVVVESSASLDTTATRNEHDLAVVQACGLDPDNVNVAQWNADGRLVWFNCNGSNIAELDLSGCSALGNVVVRNCPNLTSLNLSGLQLSNDVSIYDNANLTTLNLDNLKANHVYVSNNDALTSLAITDMELERGFSCDNNASLASFTATNCSQIYDTFRLHDNPVLTQIALPGSSVNTCCMNAK